MGAILPIKMAYEHIQPLYTVLIVTLVGDHHSRLAFCRKNLLSAAPSSSSNTIALDCHYDFITIQNLHTNLRHHHHIEIDSTNLNARSCIDGIQCPESIS